MPIAVRLVLVMLSISCFVSQLNVVAPFPAVDLNSAKIVVLYESILDADTENLIRLLTETHAEVVFRAHFKWRADYCLYPKLADMIRMVRARLPWIHIAGGISGAAFMKDDYWPNGTLVSSDAKRQMILLLPNGTMARHSADPSNFYVLDISMPLARQFILEYAYRFIDAGFDSLWFDELDFVPKMSRAHGLELSDQDYVKAWQQIASATKNYARDRYGSELLVSLNNGWVSAIGEPHPADPWPGQDFITVGISLKTAESQSMLDDWGGYKTQIRKVYGRLPPIMVFLDWGRPPTALSVFGNLSPQAQIRMLNLLHEAAQREGLLFVYPLHGGMVSDSLSPPYRPVLYDAVAQGTYDAIVQLTNTIHSAGAITEDRTATIAIDESVEVQMNIQATMFVTLIAAAISIGFLMIALRKRLTLEKRSQCVANVSTQS